MPPTPPILSLLTDFGRTDYYVGAVRGTLLRLAEGVVLADLSHDVPPGDVEHAAHLLAAAVASFPPQTIHLAVVDPGVGTERRILAAEGPAGRFVAPDNGLLHHLLDGLTVYRVDRSDLFYEVPGATFHGRDRFAPVAAALARGVAVASLGSPIDDPVRLAISPPSRSGDDEGGSATGRVAHVDRFGNLVTDLPAAWLPDGTGATLTVDGKGIRRWVRCYEELPADEPGALVGSLGTLEASLRGSGLADRWGVRRGAPAILTWSR